MKKTIKTFFVFGLTTAVMILQSISYPVSAWETGDVDENGSIAVEDACLALQAYAEKSAGTSVSLTPEQQSVADINSDGIITVEDAVFILQYYAMQSAGLSPTWEYLLLPESEKMYRQLSQQTLAIINQERIQNNLQPLATLDSLYQAASMRASELEQKFDHTRPDGSSTFTALYSYHISFSHAAENIASGYLTPESVVNGWMHSTGHRDNILNETYTTAAVGIHQSTNGMYYWSVYFID